MHLYSVIGHAHPGLKKAVSEQLDRINHCSNLYYIPEQAALAKWLIQHSCADKAFFCNSGAEANEAAIKLTRKYAHTKLDIDVPVIITAINSFHGRTLTTITATGQPKYQKDFGPLTPGFEYTEYNNVQKLREKVALIQSSGGGRRYYIYPALFIYLFNMNIYYTYYILYMLYIMHVICYTYYILYITRTYLFTSLSPIYQS